MKTQNWYTRQAEGGKQEGGAKEAENERKWETRTKIQTNEAHRYDILRKKKHNIEYIKRDDMIKKKHRNKREKKCVRRKWEC